MIESDRPKKRVLRRVKNKEGTRVLRSIVCARCGKADQIEFAPRDAERALCRACAFEVLAIEDKEGYSRPERQMKCVSCGRIEKTRAAIPADAEFQCADCFRGILSKQANRSQHAERLSRKVIRVRNS